MQVKNLTSLMLLSWEIQRKPVKSGKTKSYYQQRRKALQAAWAIFLNEDITIYHLVKKRIQRKPAKPINTNKLSLFKATF